MNINDQVSVQMRTQLRIYDKVNGPVNDMVWILVEQELWNRIWIQINQNIRLQLLYK